jgi:transglutaminase-like putative cysteine protease
LVPNESLYESIAKLSEKIFTEFEFNSGATTINTPLSEVLKLRKGVCQDFTHLMIACLRSFGFAARYVSGYLETLPPKGKVKLQGSDALMFGFFMCLKWAGVNLILQIIYIR